MIQWDTDADISIIGKHEVFIRRSQTPRSKVNSSQINIVTRLGDYCPINDVRLSCEGQRVQKMVDECSFCGPIARVFTKNVHIDIYNMHLKTNGSRPNYLLDEALDYGPPQVVPVNIIFPLRICTFMGLRVLCPNNPTDYLLRKYKYLERPHRQCVNGTWSKTK